MWWKGWKGFGDPRGAAPLICLLGSHLLEAWIDLMGHRDLKLLKL